MDLETFANGIPSFAALQHSEKVKLFAWFLHVAAGQDDFVQSEVERAYNELHLDRPSSLGPYLKRMADQKQILRGGRGWKLERKVREEIREKYGLSVSKEPAQPPRADEFDGRRFHPEVTKVCRKLYIDEHRVECVGKACKALFHVVRTVTGRTDDGKSLVAEAFSPRKPPPIRLPASITDTTLQEGVMFLAMGIAEAFRNPTMHGDPALDDAEVLEMLGTVSYLLRQIDRRIP
jgi:uncharacterized protein (TIGR02391 family)